MKPAVLEQGDSCWYCGSINFERTKLPCPECSSDEDFLLMSEADLIPLEVSP